MASHRIVSDSLRTAAALELFPLWWNELSFEFDPILDGEPIHFA